MKLRCPVCKAENAMPSEAGEAREANSPSFACRRCKADLSLAVALEQQRAAALARARLALRERRHGDAHFDAALANQLRSDQTSRSLLALTALICRDHALAWRLWRQNRESVTS